jgi:peptidoglycan/LPS O-acetylase OafA/YrhL
MGFEEFILIKFYKYFAMHLFVWFYIGIGLSLYEYYSKNKYYIILPFIATSLTIFSANVDLHDKCSLFLAYLIFISSIKINLINIFLSNKFFLFFGFISYPLYLMHENFIVSFQLKYINYLSNYIYFSLIPPLLLLIGASYLISKYWEPTAIRFLRSLK